MVFFVLNANENSQHGGNQEHGVECKSPSWNNNDPWIVVPKHIFTTYARLCLPCCLFLVALDVPGYLIWNLGH